MQLTIDIGNSSLKAALFPNIIGHITKESNKKGHTTEIPSLAPQKTIRIDLIDQDSFKAFVLGESIDACIVSSTSDIPSWLLPELTRHGICNVHIMDGTTPLPITNLYSTPSTLGTDRIAGIVGGYFMAGCNHPVLCIDIGTAITYDFITSNGEYLGGNISPGIDLRFLSLHEHTRRLPLVSPSPTFPPIGDSTHAAILSGVMTGVLHEIRGYIASYRRKYIGVYVFFTGGSEIYFANRLKSRIFADENLVMKGLNIILNYINDKK